MKVCFSRKRLGASRAERVEGHVNQSVVDEFYVGIAETCSVEMTRQKLQEPIVRGNDIIDVLLPFRKIRLICGSEFLLPIEWIWMSWNM